jgi:hypothetical protein
MRLAGWRNMFASRNKFRCARKIHVLCTSNPQAIHSRGALRFFHGNPFSAARCGTKRSHRDVQLPEPHGTGLEDAGRPDSLDLRLRQVPPPGHPARAAVVQAHSQGSRAALAGAADAASRSYHPGSGTLKASCRQSAVASCTSPSAARPGARQGPPALARTLLSWRRVPGAADATARLRRSRIPRLHPARRGGHGAALRRGPPQGVRTAVSALRARHAPGPYASIRPLRIAIRVSSAWLETPSFCLML